MTTAPSPSTPAGFFDARPLVDPVDPRDVDAFTRATRATDGSGGIIASWVIALAVVIVFLMPVVGMALMSAGNALFDVGGILAGALLALLLTAGLIVGTVLIIRRSLAARRLIRYRLSRFAAANAMSFVDSIVDPPLPGMLFSHGRSRRSTSVLRGQSPRFVEFGNYQYTTSSGKHSRTEHWGYIAVKLDVPLPHIVLDAHGDNTLGGALPLGLSPDQRLSLEGDFDRYFSLFCPAGYEVDALYLFTPDVMVRFIDHVAQLDVEIVDDWLFLYTRRPVSTLDPANWAWLFGAVGSLLTKLDQWARWRDDRLRAQIPPAGAATSVPPIPLADPMASAPLAAALPFAAPAGILTPPPPGVAPPGQRLRRSSPWLMLAIIVLVTIGFAFLPMFLAAMATLVSH